jgi:hypothetical protein
MLSRNSHSRLSLKTIRRFVFLSALAGMILCGVLLLNFTASNPTHRRYSSQTPLTTGQGSAGAIGLDAERILAKDLGLTPNDRAGQRKCICESGATFKNECNSCFITLPGITGFRRPDFISPKFIAESKNQQDLLYTARDFDQIRDFAQAAKALHIPLWVYIRVDTTIDSPYKDLVKSTGGGIVRYFTVPGYQDPTDQAAQTGLVVCAALFSGTLLIELRPHVRVSGPRPRRSAQQSVQDGEDFVQKVRSKALSRLDKHDH